MHLSTLQSLRNTNVAFLRELICHPGVLELLSLSLQLRMPHKKRACVLFSEPRVFEHTMLITSDWGKDRKSYTCEMRHGRNGAASKAPGCMRTADSGYLHGISGLRPTKGVAQDCLYLFTLSTQQGHGSTSLSPACI